MGKLTAPKVKYYIDCLKHVPQGGLTLDAESYRLLDIILDRLRTLKPCSENGTRRLWLEVDRGPIEDFGDFDEWLEAGEVSSREEFEQEWLGYFPDESWWVPFGAVYVKDVDYKAIEMGHRIIIETAPRFEKGFEHDIREFMEWLLEAVEDVIARVKAGTYNAHLEKNLPFQHRFGTISRKSLWEVFPEDRQAYFEGLPVEDVDEFIRLMECQDKNVLDRPPFPSFTAKEFYRCCALGYTACGYPVDGLTPEEMYCKFADGRDDGLSEIERDSPEAFRAWLEDGRGKSGHPWEVCRGGNSTHVSLFVWRDKNGYYLVVDGCSYGRSVEAIHFFLALWRAGYPVAMRQGELLKARLRGIERIGIVPSGIIPRYCEEYFPGDLVKSFMNFPEEYKDKLLKYCTWQPVPLVELQEGGEK